MVLATSISELHVSCTWTHITSAQLSVVFLNMVIVIYNVITIVFGSIPGETVTKFRCKMNLIIQGGADESLGRPTSRCCITELVVSLESRVCSCAKLQVFS